MPDIIIVCSGGCGRTTEDITCDTPEKEIGRFVPVDESGVPDWTCPECLVKEVAHSSPA